MSFTPNDAIGVILAICGGIITVSAALSIIWKAVEKARQPETEQNQRISSLESTIVKMQARFNEYDSYLDRDKKRLDNLEFGNEATNEALLALLNHAINGEDKEGLKLAKKKLEKYLISRKDFVWRKNGDAE